MAAELRSVINGRLFREFMGKNVSVFVKFEEHNSQILKARTTDQVPIRVSLSKPLSGNCTGWVEVIGVVSGQDMIRATEVITFEDCKEEFDCESHNMLMIIMHNVRDFYASG